MTYKPLPVETGDIELDPQLTELIEVLAKNVHERWAINRINEGWQFGPGRDDRKKQHPCLVPYEQLPESEKEYDRTTAVETLKLIQKNGFDIIKK